MKKLLLALLLLPSIVFAQERVNDGIMSKYWFQEGTGSLVQDVATTSNPVHLTIANPSNVTWINGGGISLNSPTKISSTNNPWWRSTIEANGEFSMEAWVKPENYNQFGPARIAAYSVNASSGGGNFILGQSYDQVDIRIKTSASNVWGMPGAMSSLPTGLVHIVVTRSTAQITTIYVNGTKLAEAPDSGTIAGWVDCPFSLGDDQSSDRPWLGEMYFFGLFDRALTEPEIVQNYTYGHLYDGDGPVDPPVDVPVDTRYTWTAPTTGTPVDHYIVEKRDARNTTWFTYATTQDPSVTVGGLAGVTQWIRVRGVDDQDREGPWSDSSDPYAPPFPEGEPPGQPGKPYRVK